MADDGELLARWRDGDKDAGQELVTRHFRGLYLFFINKIGDAAEDLVQRTVLAAVANKHRIRSDGSFRGYLFTVARHELYAAYRERAAVRERIDFAASSAEDLDPSPSRMLGQREEHRLLLAGLRSIPLDFQIALELHYWEGLPTAELANVLGLARGTVKSRLRRAREALVAALERLADSPEALASTVDDLDRWAASIREELDWRKPDR